MKEFADFVEAFDYVRELDKPVKVLIAGMCYRLFPSGFFEWPAPADAPAWETETLRQYVKRNLGQLSEKVGQDEFLCDFVAGLDELTS